MRGPRVARRFKFYDKVISQLIRCLNLLRGSRERLSCRARNNNIRTGGKRPLKIILCTDPRARGRRTLRRYVYVYIHTRCMSLAYTYSVHVRNNNIYAGPFGKVHEYLYGITVIYVSLMPWYYVIMFFFFFVRVEFRLYYLSCFRIVQTKSPTAAAARA